MIATLKYYGRVIQTIFNICSPAIFFGLAWYYTDLEGLSTMFTLFGIFSLSWMENARMPLKPVKA